VFYTDDRQNPPIQSAAPIAPGTEACAGRAFVLTYYGRTVAMRSFHSVVDGGGINAIFSTLLYTYLSSYTGVRDQVPTVELREGRSPESYYASLASMDMSDFEQQPLVTYTKRKGMFRDLDMAPDDEGNVQLARLRFCATDFMSACKRIGANPSAMMCVLMAKAAYELHPQRTGNLGFMLTMSARNAFGIPDSIANCSTNMLLPVEHDDIVASDLRPAVKKIRANIDLQRSTDYIKTQASFYETYDWMVSEGYCLLTYIGALDIGANTGHIVDFEMTDDAVSSLFMIELNGDFVLSLQLGKATGKYLDVITKDLHMFGVQSETVSSPQRITPEHITSTTE